MNRLFFVAAAVMIAAALVLLLLPLLRHGRRSTRPRSIFALALMILFVLPATAAGLYLLVGTPAALDPQAIAAQPRLTMQQALAQLHQHLAQHPDDVQAWMLLAQTDAMQQKPGQARDAYDHVLKLDPNNAEAMVGWAETDSMVRSDHQIQGRALALLKQAVQLQPDSQRGLWLLGISDFQQKKYADAAATWRLLQPQLEPGSEVAEAVGKQIAVADSRAGGTTASTRKPAPAAAAASLQVKVSLAPALRQKLHAGDTLFVYARAASGAPMPLAVTRLDPSQLPAQVTLNDAMAMMPGHDLSSVDRVFVGARISHSGQPLAQAGDLEGNAGIVAVDDRKPLTIIINQVHL